jgi:CHASE2 domain-containing sensor protein
MSRLSVLARDVCQILRSGPISYIGLLLRWSGLRNLVLSNLALLSRQLGARAIILVGIFATLYAIYLFAVNQIAPGATTASHDVILKTRWASPEPSPKVVVVDIDERSLAALSPEYGRWPWPRNVLADGLDRMKEAGVQVVLFNVLFTDPDRSNPDADSAMEVAAALTPNVVFPAVRLNPDNDTVSQLVGDDLLRRTGDPVRGDGSTVALLLPMFESMLNRIGIANQKPDSDGIVRKYPLVWVDDRLTMPSVVLRALSLGRERPTESPEMINLNWRNKTGRYTRISFSDLLKAPQGDLSLALLKDSYVVLGVSAPGLGMTKPTAVRAIEDDNEILATALDDVLSDTHLRVMPSWLVLLVEIVTVWILVWVGIGRSFGATINKAFIAFQGSAATITLISASYTSYLVDLSTCMAFGAGLFGTIKLVSSLDAGWSRARPGLRTATTTPKSGKLLLIGYRDSEVNLGSAKELQRSLELEVGFSRVIRVDDLFGGESFARAMCEDFSCQICLIYDEEKGTLLTALEALKFHDSLEVREFDLEVDWNPDSVEFRGFLAPKLLRQCADFIDASNIRS